jgi:hypothetical protein
LAKSTSDDALAPATTDTSTTAGKAKKDKKKPH